MYFLLLGFEYYLDVGDASLEEVDGLLDLMVAPDRDLAGGVTGDEVA